jgi:multiple sugar transport system permease protein
MWSNYVHVFQVFDFGTYMGNTIVVAIFSTLGTLITTILAAFAFSRLNFKGREAVFSVFLMTMMIPGEMMVITNYITVASFGWIGNGQTRLRSLFSHDRSIP